MKKLSLSAGLTAAVAIVVVTAGFARGQSLAPGRIIDSEALEPNPRNHDGLTPGVTLDSSADARRDWNNSGTDFNTDANWSATTGGVAPGAGDVAWFTSAKSTDPNLSASLSIAGLYFQSTSSSGYNITRSGSAAFTLTGYASNVTGTQDSDATAVAIGANNTTGTNTIAVAIVLAPASGSTSTIFQAGGGTLEISGVISGSASLSKTGGGTLILSATNTYTGDTTISGGTVVLANATDTLPDNSFLQLLNGSTLSLGTNNDTVGNVVLEAGSNIAGTGGTLTSTNYDMRSGSVTANLAGTGTTLTKSSSGGLSLTGTNTYSGGTTINGGDVTFNNSSALGTGAIAFGPNGLDSMSLMSTTAVSLSNDITINDLSLTAGRTATLGSFSTASSGTNAYTGNITLNNDLRIKSSSPNSNPLTFSSGVISGSGGLIINPSGTISPGAVKLAGDNTYTGATSISAGTLLVTGGVVGSVTNSATGTGNVTVTGTGTILAGGSTSGTTGSILGTVNIGSGAKLSPGPSGSGSGNTAILHTGALTLSSGSFFNVDLNSTTAGSGYDQVISSGAINLSGSTLSVAVGGALTLGDKFFILENSSVLPNGAGTFTNGATITSGGYTFLIDYADSGDGGLTLNDISLTVAVPEPSTWVTGVLTFAALLYSQRRRLKRSRK